MAVDARIVEDALDCGYREPVLHILAVHDPVPAGAAPPDHLHPPLAVRCLERTLNLAVGGGRAHLWLRMRLFDQLVVTVGVPEPAVGATKAFRVRLRPRSPVVVPVSVLVGESVRLAVWISTARD